MAKNWIQGMHMKKGALHSALHIPQGHKIPRHVLERAASAGGELGKRARLALTLGKLRKK